VNLHDYLKDFELPEHMKFAEGRMQDHRSEIAMGYNEHVARVGDHSAMYGFREFQVHSRRLSLAVSTALHLLEQPFAQTDSMVGPYSPSNGLIIVRQPGKFSAVRDPNVTWAVNDDGTIEPVA
jgi:hypothetical protein